MPLQKGKATSRAKETFERLNALPKTTVALSFRLPLRDRDRLREHFARDGLSLAQGLKMITVRYMNETQ
jgi:hypothetical protein